MARDTRTALVALNRFGFGARGGASGDLVNAASDPRGFVKAELGRANVLLEVPGLLSTPDLAKAVFAYQAEVKQAREAAVKSAASSQAAPEMSEKTPVMEAPAKGGADAAMQSPEAMQPNAAKPPAQPLNIIQKTYRAEALARLQRAAIAEC